MNFKVKFSPRLLERAKRSSVAVVNKALNMKYRDLKPLLVCSDPHTVGISISLKYSDTGSFESVSADIADPEVVRRDMNYPTIYLDADPDMEAQKVLATIYCDHIKTVFKRRHGNRPLYVMSDDELMSMSDKWIIDADEATFEWGKAKSDDVLVNHVLAEFALAELDARRIESNHAFLTRLGEMKESAQ
ncbi:hypothetical protein [Sulfitobacter sp. 1A13679]|uniref:hypothetical protein n=1 Tax=Sulfitobacter sp. 1A13679 TaxID=3368597 RepID=UPI0037474122